MPDTITIQVDGKPVSIEAGVSVAAAIWIAGGSRFRTSVSGEPRAALCGMGICFECRVTIDDQPHARSCQIAAHDGMRVVTG